MGCRVLFDAEDNLAALYDSVTGTAFGETFGPCENGCCEANEIAHLFLDYLRDDKGFDARELDARDLTAHRQSFAEGGLCMKARTP